MSLEELKVGNKRHPFQTGQFDFEGADVDDLSLG